ncbi:MAG: prolyl oligopeptidase family serine peptidase [Planctomycetaceae bacterium]|nr:prolyl oligopeptidase family serine peptidase [Planctomycetaceae bacterium]
MRPPIPLAAVCCIVFLVLVAPWHSAAAEIPPIPRVLPPEGLEIPADVRERLQSRLAATKKRMEAVRDSTYRVDVEIFTKAVELALAHREFYVPKDFDKAGWALDEANRRLDWRAEGMSPWVRASGTVVQGYYSSIDGSAQPFGLVIPQDHDHSKPCPLYVWLHGRGDRNTDLHFLHERATKTGQITPPGAIILHPFGRHCVGWKHAGEIDVLEAIARVEKRFTIDPHRIVLIGFSMGGAGAWHIGAHYADRWIAVSPGAGFAETARYQRLTPDKYPPEYEQKLWGLYDVPGYVRNLFNTRTIAYSGELDKQIQAARMMEEAYKSEGRTLEHLIGPGVEHKYEPKTLQELLHRLESVLHLTDLQEFRQPREVDLQTRTLRYARLKWLAAEGLEEHWKDARIHGWRTSDGLVVKTKNVSRVALILPGLWGADSVAIDGQPLGKPPLANADVQPSEDGQHYFPPVVTVKEDGHWRWIAHEATDMNLRKRPGLQGPIDDAFMGPFVVVAPSGKSRNPAFQAWCEFELAHFRSRWQALMRGELPIKSDVDVRAADLATGNNLILWGDADSNLLIKQLADKLPVQFSDRQWKFGDATFDGNRFVPALIFPGPLRSRKASYIVLNSGLTFREAHDNTNSQQNPKLPDWAIIDITQPPSAYSPGRIHDAGFFDEEWQLKGPVKGP